MLSEIAGDMKIEAATGKRKSMRKLSRGLELTLYDRDEHYYLRLYRPGAKVSPSENEVKICKNAFFGNEESEQEDYRPDSRGGTAYWIKVLK